MCGFYFIAFIEYVIAGKKLLDYTNFSFHLIVVFILRRTQQPYKLFVFNLVYIISVKSRKLKNF